MFKAFLRNLRKEKDSGITCFHMSTVGLFLALIIKEILCLIIFITNNIRIG